MYLPVPNARKLCRTLHDWHGPLPGYTASRPGPAADPGVTRGTAILKGYYTTIII